MSERGPQPEDESAADAEAAAWLARQRGGGAQARDEAGFRQWLAADPAHGRAYAAMQATLGRVQALPPEAVAALRARAVSSSASSAPTRPDRRRAWRPAFATVLMAAAGGGLFLGVSRWQSQPDFEARFATVRGQQQQVELPDGSRLLLDTATEAEVRLYRDRREVRLLDGQVFFSVQADASRPFHVLAGLTRVTVVGTRFSVRHTRQGLGDGGTRVAVEEGRVRVQRQLEAEAVPAEAAERIELAAGERVAADALGRLGPVAHLEAAAVAPWRDGRVSFEDTPLAQALAELERYGDTRLVIRDPAVAALRIGGSFDLRHLGSFAQALPQLLPVRLQPRDGVTEIVGVR